MFAVYAAESAPAVCIEDGRGNCLTDNMGAEEARDLARELLMVADYVESRDREAERPAGFEGCSCDPDDGHSSPCLFACRECGETTAVEYGMCEACIHDATRSGWTPGSDES